MLQSLVVEHDLELYLMVVETAFLHGHPQWDYIYMETATRLLEKGRRAPHVLNKSIYGLKTVSKRR